VRKFPWLSLLLLLIAYSTFSWFLYEVTATRIVWVAALVFTLLQALLLTTLSDSFKGFINNWLNSDLGYFSLVILLGLFSVALLVWVHILGRMLLLISAEVLARLDLQHAGINNTRALAVLTSVSFLGLAIGWVGHHYGDVTMALINQQH
jgi:hypothetical protein